MNYYIAEAGGQRRGPFTPEQMAAFGLPWQSTVNGTQRGPFETEQMVEQGLRPDTLVWAEGMTQWVRADQVVELRPLFAQSQAGGVPPGGGYVSHPAMQSPAGSNSTKTAAGLCAIFFGAFGVHKFMLGMTGTGILMLVITCTCVGYPVMHIIGIIEGIIYLTKTDAEFHQLYVVEKKQWF